MDRLTGQTLGNYELETVLGRGGMGVVYLAVHRRLRQHRAVKVLPPQMALDDLFLERFNREAKIAAGLQHPNIVRVYDVGEDGGLHYIVMELVEGTALNQLVEEEGPLPPVRARDFLNQLASALDYAHGHGVVHRDLKAANVFIGPFDHLTLLDFGIAKAMAGTRLTRTGVMIGTPEYMAPEAINRGDFGPLADLYALGILAFEMLTGRVPFNEIDSMRVLYGHANLPPPTPTSLRADLPEAVDPVILRQLAKEPTERFPTALEFVSALTAALGIDAGEPATSRSELAREEGGDHRGSDWSESPTSPDRIAPRPAAAGTWLSTGGMSSGRRYHTATPLPDGTLLVAGGNEGGPYRLASIELYDPRTGAWSGNARMPVAHRFHTATLLADGRVLIAGGYVAQAEIIDPTALAEGQAVAWSNVNHMSSARRDHTACLLSDGRVLVCGGLDNSNTALASAEIFSPESRGWARAGRMATARSRHCATVLLDGRVLVTGGNRGPYDNLIPLSAAEIYDPATNTWSSAGSMTVPRLWHTATLLDDGRVLVTGGADSAGVYLATAETFDPETGFWEPAGEMAAPRVWHTATLLPGGRVLVAGGNDRPGGYLATAEIYHPHSRTWTPTASLHTPRAVHTATLLSSRVVLVAGGLDAGLNKLASAEIYVPESPQAAGPRRAATHTSPE
jgi:serine/threonine protein kinase